MSCFQCKANLFCALMTCFSVWDNEFTVRKYLQNSDRQYLIAAHEDKNLLMLKTVLEHVARPLSK